MATINFEKSKKKLLNGELLPSFASSPRGLEALEDHGMVFHDSVHPLFKQAHLPDGWSVQPVSGCVHEWTLLDDEENERASILYTQDAGQCPRAKMEVLARYCIEIKNFVDTVGVFVRDRRALTTIHSSRAVIGRRESRDEAKKRALRRAKDWLYQNRPEWKDPAAYW